MRRDRTRIGDKRGPMLGRLILTTLLASVFAGSACGGASDANVDPFDTFQACFDAQHGTGGLSPYDAILTCCVDHPIAGVKPACGASDTDCSSYVDAQLSAASATADDIDAACIDYVSQLSS